MTANELREQRRAMMAAYRERIDNPPNLRDYYPNHDAYKAATLAHQTALTEELTAIERVSEHINALART